MLRDRRNTCSTPRKRILLVTSESGGPPKSVAQRAQLLKKDYDITAFFLKGRKPNSTEFPVLEAIKTYDEWPNAKDLPIIDVIEVSDAEALVKLNSLNYLNNNSKLIYTARSEQLVEENPGGTNTSEDKKKVRNQAWDLLMEHPPTKWVFLSKSLKQKFSDKFAEKKLAVEETNISVIGNPLQRVWEEKMQQFNEVASPQFDDNTLLTYVGRLSKMKGTDLLVKALKLAKIHPNRVALIGPSEENSGIDFGNPNDNDCDYRNSIKGKLEPEDIIPLVRGSIFIFPSTSEAFGNALQEAMSQGAVCIINSATPSLLELLQPLDSPIDKDLLTFDGGSESGVEKLASNITTLLRPELRPTLQQESQRVRELISANQEKINKQVVALYESVFSREKK